MTGRPYLVTHGPYLSTLEIRVGIIKRYRNCSVYFTLPALIGVADMQVNVQHINRLLSGQVCLVTHCEHAVS